MNNTVWGDRRPGETSMDVSDQLGDGPETVVTLHYTLPDWVRVPPELGGHKVKVTGSCMIPCPCKGNHHSKVLLTDDPTDLGVVECTVTSQFMWVRLPKEG